MAQSRVRFLDIRDLPHAIREIQRVGADVQSWEIMAPKAICKVVKVSQVPFPAAAILKQEMLSLGAEAAVDKGVVTARKRRSDVLLMGTIGQLRRLAEKIATQPFGLDQLAEDIGRLLAQGATALRHSLRCRDLELPLGQRPLTIGVLNVTPDSFSDGGQYNTLPGAVDRAWQMVHEGADIIDVGGESTRPGANPVSLKEELSRVIPVVEQLCDQLHIPISIDTYKAEVARQALRAGAHIVNDISALRFDPKMAGVVARRGAALILMHMKGTPGTMQKNPRYRDVMAEIYDFLSQQAEKAADAGISGDRLVIDPGIGFGKRVEDNLTIINRLGEFRSMGLPVLVGVSRKSFIGKILDVPVDDRLEGTAAAVALAVARGADFVRVHDVKEMARAASMAYAISTASS